MRQVEWLGRAPQMSEYPIDDRCSSMLAITRSFQPVGGE
jgi:hypothetical protein